METMLDIEAVELTREICASEGMEWRDAVDLANARLIELLAYAWLWDEELYPDALAFEGYHRRLAGFRG